MSFVQLAFIEYLFVCNRHNAVVPMVCPFLFFQHYVKLSIFVYITRLHKIGLHFPLCKNVVYIISCVFLREKYGGNMVSKSLYHKILQIYNRIFVYFCVRSKVAQGCTNICFSEHLFGYQCIKKILVPARTKLLFLKRVQECITSPPLHHHTTPLPPTLSTKSPKTHQPHQNIPLLPPTKFLLSLHHHTTLQL